MHHGLLVAEPAVAAAYALLGQEDPLAAAAAVVGGYHAAFPLEEEEIRHLFALVSARLAVSVTTSAMRATRAPGDPYVTVSEAPAWEALERLDRVHPRFAHYALREACGLPPFPHGPAVVSWLEKAKAAPVLDVDPSVAPCLVLDLGVGSPFLGADPRHVETGPLTERIFGEMKRAGVTVAVGRYDEARGIYLSGAFASGGRATDERRTVHLGIDLFVEPGATVRAPLPGLVHVLANNTAPQDYGPLVILRHQTGDGTLFYTLYGHLSEDTLSGLAVGQRVEAGEVIARVGAPPANGDWPPHLHFQLVLDLLDRDADFPGVALPGQRSIWTSLSPDPNVLLRIPAERFPPEEQAPAETMAARRRLLGHNLSLSYRRPLKIVRGFAQYLYDESGRAYLDAYNNVPLVGHSHPRVVRAAQEQLALLNTNTRYLHDTILRYAERLTRLLPEPLRVCYFVTSGSEANELALRLARARTGREDVIVLEHGYHGHTTTLVDVSPYKFDGPGGRGRKEWVHVAPLPDTYRGPYRRDDPQAGPKYARQVGALVDGLQAEGRGLAAFLAETLPSVAGQIVLPPGYLAEAYRHVRAAGGLCIADEVQTGFGRLGRLLGLRGTGRRAGRRGARQAHRQRLPARRRGHDARDRGRVRQRHGVLQHLRRQPRLLRRRPRRARRRRGGAAAGAGPARGRPPARGAAGAFGAAPAGRRRARLGPLPRGRARARPREPRAGPGGSDVRGEPPPRARGADRNGRPAPQRPQAAPAARLLGRGRGAPARDARRGAGGRRRARRLTD